MKEITFAEALREALREEMRRDDRVFIMGLDVELGYTFSVTKDLINEFGRDRVMDTPISEEAIIGAAVGAAMMGMRPVVEILFSDLLTVCMDPLVNQAAKLRYMTAGKLKIPMVVRTPGGKWTNFGAQHSQTLDSWFIHVPGIKVVVPSTPEDAKGLLKTSIRDDNPVLFIEHKHLYRIKGVVPEEECLIPFGKGIVRREGKDVTIVAISNMVHKSMAAAKSLEEDGINVEIIDPRTLNPLDEDLILSSVKKTGHLVIVEEGCKMGGVGAEISAIVAEKAIDYLDSPIVRVAAANVPIPMSPPLENYVIPDVDHILRAVHHILGR